MKIEMLPLEKLPMSGMVLKASMALTKLFILALDMNDLGPNHPWRHVYLKMLDEGEAGE